MANTPIEIGATHSVTENTPKNIMLGAGVIVHGLSFSTSKWQYTGIFGATNGGSKVEITPTYQDLEVDGILVKTKGLTVKMGEEAKLTTNLVECTKENLTMVSGGMLAEATTATGYDEIVSKPQLDKDDYIENLGFIGYTIDGSPIIIKFDNALCTSGLSFEGKNKEQATVEAVFECYADLSTDNLTVLPWHIYTKTVASV